MANRKPSAPFRWVSPISETTFQNYVQRKPPVQHNNLDVLHQVLVSDGAEPQKESITRNFTRDVPTARRMLRSAADSAIGKYGLFDDRTKQLLNVIENEENEDAYLRELFTKGEVDDDRLRQLDIDRQLSDEELKNSLDQDRMKEWLKKKLMPHELLGSMPSVTGLAADNIKDVVEPHTGRDDEANSRATAEAFLNKELKGNPDAYKNLALLNQTLKDRNVPLKVREHAVELARSRQREDIANGYLNELAASPNAPHRPEYYTADISKLGYAKVEEYLGRLQQQLDTETANQLHDFKQRMDKVKKEKLPLVANDPIEMYRFNAQYNDRMEQKKKELMEERNQRYQQLIPFNDTDVQQLRSAIDNSGAYGKSPSEAAAFLGTYHDRLLRSKLTANPNMDRELFEQLWQKVATEMVHTYNGRPTKLGVLTTVQLRQGMMARLGNESNEWRTAFGINNDKGDRAAEEYDEAARQKDYLAPDMGMDGVSLGVYEKVRYHGEKVLGSIATLMGSDEANDEQEARIKDKLSRKVKLTFDEQQLLEAMRYRDMMKEMSGRTNPYFLGGEAVTDMVPYTLQFMAGNKLMSMAGFASKLRPVFRAAEEGVKLSKMARATNALRNSVEQMKQSAAITAMFPQMANINANRRMYVDTGEISSDGSVSLAFDRNDPLTSTLKGYTEAFIDNYTEQLGTGIDRAFVYGGKGLKWGAVKVGLGKALSRADKALNKSSIIRGIAGRTAIGSAYMDDNASKGVREWMRMAGRNGIVGEYLEEEASRNMGNVVLGDNDGKLQFADSEFLKTTGSSVLAYSLLSGGLFTGVNAATSRVSVSVPVLDENGNVTDQLQKVKVSRRALEVIGELEQKGELTPERLSSLAGRYKKDQADYIRRYGTNLMEKKAELEELKRKKAELEQQGVKPEELDRMQSMTQANEVVEHRELLDAGYGEVNDKGFVKLKLDKLKKDIELAKAEVDKLTTEGGEAEQINQAKVQLSKLEALMGNFIQKQQKRMESVLQLSEESSYSDYLDRYQQLNNEVSQLSMASDTHENAKKIVERRQAMAMLYEQLMATTDYVGADELLTEMEQQVELQEATINRMVQQVKGMDEAKRAEQHQLLLAEQEKLERYKKHYEMVAGFAEQLRLNKEAQQTTKDRDEAIERMNAEEMALTGELTNTKPSENKQIDETLPPPPNVVNDGNGNLKPYQPTNGKPQDSSAMTDAEVLKMDTDEKRAEGGVMRNMIYRNSSNDSEMIRQTHIVENADKLFVGEGGHLSASAIQRTFNLSYKEAEDVKAEVEKHIRNIRSEKNIQDSPVKQDEESNSIPEGPLLLHTMVRYNEKGKIVGDKKAVKTMLEKSLDLPKEASLKVSFAGGTVTAEVTYKGRKLKYKLLRKLSDGSQQEVDKDSLIGKLSNDMMAVDQEEVSRARMESQRKAMESCASDPRMALITEIADADMVEKALLDTMAPADAARLTAILNDAAKRSGKSIGEVVLNVAASLYRGDQTIASELVDGFGRALPKMVDAYEQQLSNAGAKMSSDGPTISNRPDGSVESSKPAQSISSEEAIRRISSISILQTVNEIENRQTELIAKSLKDEFESRRSKLERDRAKIDEVANSRSLTEVDAIIGDRSAYEQWLLSNEVVGKEYANSHNTYTGIRNSKSADSMSHEQYETLQTFRHMGLLTNDEVKGYAGSRLNANEGIHLAVLRLYALMLGNQGTPKSELEQLKKYNRLINSQRTNARIMDRIAVTAGAINRMVQAYNTRYALMMDGKLTKEADEKAGPTVASIAQKVIGAIEDQVKEHASYYQQLSIHNDMMASIPDYNGQAPKKPKALDLSQAESTVKAVAAYAIRLNGELLDDSAAINREINEVAMRLTNAIAAVNKTLQEINKSRKGVAPMIGGLSIDSPALKGDTVEQCLDAIISAGGENARSARYLKGKSFGEVKLRRVSDQEFEQLLNKHGLNHNTVAFYNSAINEILLNEVTGNHEQALLHELTHRLTLKAIEEDANLNEQLNVLFNNIKEALQTKGLLDGSYGFSSATEFIAEYHANGAFARMVNQADSPTSYIGKLVAMIRNLIRRMVGLPESVSVHDRIIFLTDDLVDRSELLSTLVSHEPDEVKNHIYALEASGTPARRNARSAFIQLMMAVDNLDKQNLGTLSYVGIEDRISRALAVNPSIAVEAFAKAGYEYDGEISNAANELLEAMRENSLFRYEVIAYRIRQWSKQQLEQKAEYEAAANDAASTAQERFEAQQKAFNPIVKNIAKLLGQTRDNVEVQLINRLKQNDVTDAIFSEGSYQLWLDNLDDEATVSAFDRALGVSLGQGWSYKSFVSAVSFYRACRLERHLKIMFDKDGKAYVSTVNSGAEVKNMVRIFSRNLTSFAAIHTVFEFGSHDGPPTEQERKAKKKKNTYTGMMGMLKYVGAVRASMADDYAKGRTTRMEEYQRELNLLQNLTGIGSNRWDMLLSSEGYDNQKVLNVGKGADNKTRFARVTFTSYKDYCEKLDRLRMLFSDKKHRTVEQVESEAGVKLEGLQPNDTVYISDYNGYFFSNDRGYLKDKYPVSVMTNTVLSKLGVSEIEALTNDKSEANIVALATATLTQLFMGKENYKGDAVPSNIEQLVMAVSTKDTLVSSGFGVDNNRINGMVLNSSLHHIAENITSVGIDNALVRFYDGKGVPAEPVVLNGMVDLNDRDNPKVYDKLNNVDYWRSQLVLFVNGKDSYYASMGVFSDKGRGLFIEAPKHSVTWNNINKTKDVYRWSRFSNNSYEVSSQGDKRFSALYAKLKDGRTIEEAYQLDVKGYRSKSNNWKEGKGKAPIRNITKEEQWNEYKALWKTYLNENPALLEDLIKNANGKVLTDKFATTDISQARALSEILNETTDSTSNGISVDFAEHEEMRQLFPDFDESLAYFLNKYAFKIVPKSLGLTSEMERRVATEFFVSFVRNIKDINEVFQGEGYKNLTDMVKRGAPVISPGYNPLPNVEGGLEESYSHMVISDIINMDGFGNEYELANGIQFATRKWFDQLTNSVGEVYANTEKYGKLSSTKALTTGINRTNGQRFLTKTNIICIDEMAHRLGGRWATLRDFMYEHEIDTVSSPSGTKKNAHIPSGTERLQKRLNKPGEKDKFDGAFDLFGLDPKSYTKEDVKLFLQPYYTNDLYVQQDLRHESISSWSKNSKQQRMNFVSIEGWSDVFENLINQQVQARINTFNIQYIGARSEEEKKLVLANAIIDRQNMLTKPIRSMDDLADALSSDRYSVDEEDREQLLAIMNPNAKLSYPSIAKWVRTKLSSALRTGAIEIKVNRTATQELPDLNEEHIGYKIVDSNSWELSEAMSKLTKGTYKLRPRVRLAEASTSDGGKHMRQAQYFEIKDSIEQTLFDAIRYAYKLQDMFDLNEDGSIPKLPKFDGSIHSNFRAHELRIEEQGGVRYIVVPGEPFITNRVPGSSLVSHSVVRLRKNLGGDVNYTIINIGAQLASGSDFDGDARYNQLMQRDRNGMLKFDSSIAGINNQMVLVAAQAYNHPANYDRITRPLDVDYANTSVDAIRKKRMDRASASDRYGIKGKYHELDPIGYEDARVKNAAGVTMKAIMANLNSAFSYLKYSKVTQNEKSFKKLRGRPVEKEYSAAVYEKVHGRPQDRDEYFHFGGMVHDRYDIVKKVIENELNKAFDNAKDPRIEDQGITEATANLFVFMLSTSKSLRDAEIKLYRELDGDISWAKMKELLDGFFDRVTLEADAIFNYLNTPVVQDYIMLTRSSTVGNSLSKKKIGEIMNEKYAGIPGGIGQLELLQDLLMYAMDLSTVQKAVNASDTNMGMVADFIDNATAVSKILGNQLNYFRFDSKYGWDNPHSWLKGSMDSISLHAQVLYGDAMEYSETYINALNAAIAMVNDNNRNEVTKGQRIAIGSAIGQALSCSVAYPELKLKDLERVLVSVMFKHINERSNAFAAQLMLSGVPGSYRISSIASSLHSAPTDEEVMLAKEGFRTLTRNKVITINGMKYPMGEMIYLYQLMRYGNQSVKGGFMDIIGDEAIASYSKRYMDNLNSISARTLKDVMTAAVAYASYAGMQKGRIAKSSWARFFSNLGGSVISGSEFDIDIWGNDRFKELVGSIITEKESANISRIPSSMINELERIGIGSLSDEKLSSVLAEHKLSVLSDAIDSYIENDKSTELISRAKVALKLIQNRKKNPIPEERMALNMNEDENIYGEKTSTAKLMVDGRRTATTRSFPLAYMIGDAYQLNPTASVGRVFTVKEAKDHYFVVTGVRTLNLSTIFDNEAIEAWVNREGWTREQFMARIVPQLMAGKVLYQTDYRKITPEELAAAKANNGKLNTSNIINGMELPEQYKGKLIYATPTSGKSHLVEQYDSVYDMDDLIRQFLTDSGVRTEGLSNIQVGLAFVKQLQRRTQKEREAIIRPLLKRVNDIKRAGGTVLTGNSFFLEDMQHSDFGGKLKRWVNGWYISDNVERITKIFEERGEKRASEYATKLVERERKAVGDIATKLYANEYLSDRLTRSEGDATLLDKLALISESAQNLITLEELTDRVQRMVEQGFTEEDALTAIARELNCK